MRGCTGSAEASTGVAGLDTLPLAALFEAGAEISADSIDSAGLVSISSRWFPGGAKDLEISVGSGMCRKVSGRGTISVLEGVSFDGSFGSEVLPTDISTDRKRVYRKKTHTGVRYTVRRRR